MKEIRWHGRGGHGAFTAACLLGLAVSVHGGNYAQAFPSFGPERRGAPVLGFTRIDDKVILDHSHVYSCDYVVVLDETLIETVDVTKGLHENGTIFINTSKSEAFYNFGNNIKVYTIDATQIALDIMGSPITNTVMLGAIAALTDLVSLDAVYRAIEDFMPAKLQEKNKRVVEMAYKYSKGEVS